MNPGIVDEVGGRTVVESGKEEEVKEGAMEVDPDAALSGNKGDLPFPLTQDRLFDIIIFWIFHESGMLYGLYGLYIICIDCLWFTSTNHSTIPENSRAS